MGRRKLTEPKLIKSVYMPKKLWDKVDAMTAENGYKSRNCFIEKAIESYVSREQLRKSGI